MALTLRYQTAAQFAQRLRERYKTASRDDCARIAYWIIERINVGDITDAQMKNVFSLTTQQWNTLKAKLTALHDQWAGIQAAGGE